MLQTFFKWLSFGEVLINTVSYIFIITAVNSNCMRYKARHDRINPLMHINCENFSMACFMSGLLKLIINFVRLQFIALWKKLFSVQSCAFISQELQGRLIIFKWEYKKRHFPFPLIVQKIRLHWMCFVICARAYTQTYKL